MAYEVKEFNKYKTSIWHPRTGEGDECTAYIICYMDDDWVGHIMFYLEGAVVPDRQDHEPFVIHFPITRYGTILELLRQESPLYLHSHGVLSTSKEPVGEQEG